MEYKVQINSLDNFKAWSGGLTTLNTVREDVYKRQLFGFLFFESIDK